MKNMLLATGVLFMICSCKEVKVINPADDPVNVRMTPTKEGKRSMIYQRYSEKLTYRYLGSDTCDVDLTYVGGNGIHLILNYGSEIDSFVLETGSQNISIPKGVKATIVQHEHVKYFVCYTSYSK
jgi:hypothetical protein